MLLSESLPIGEAPETSLLIGKAPEMNLLIEEAPEMSLLIGEAPQMICLTSSFVCLLLRICACILSAADAQLCDYDHQSPETSVEKEHQLQCLEL